MSNDNKKYIPDGEWKGFYTYTSQNVKHHMSCYFTFSKGVINGTGNDDVGNYTWTGSYDDGLNIVLTKSYARHQVFYKGYADENGIWGNWKIIKSSGGFHLWPVKQDADCVVEKEEKQEAELVSDKAVV